jgi:VCBS repeat-containing protein
MPPLPSSFYGTVKVNGANAPVGVIISARINSVEYAHTTVMLYLSETVYGLDVPGDDPATPGVIEGGQMGNTVVFYIDGMLASPTGTWNRGSNVSLNLTAHAPVAKDQSVSTAEDTAKDITLVATDADGGTLTYSVVADPLHGTLSGSAPALLYTPAANYNGSDSFTFKAYDGTLYSNPATVSITVTAVDDAPVAVDDAYSTTEDTALVLTQANLKGNDTDVDNTNAQLSVTAASSPTHGAVVLVSGTVTFTPAANFVGTAGFDYTVSDGSKTDTGHVTITVTAVNDAPVITEGASTSVSMSEDGSPTAFSLTLHATDVDSSMLTWSILTAASHGTASASGKGAAKAISYTPTANYNGTDSFVVQVSDGTATDTITVNVTIAAVNDAPVANAQSVSTAEDTAKAITLTGSDVEGSTLTYSVVAGPSHGTLSGSAPALTYTPAANYNGSDRFTFKANDGTLYSNPAKVSITVTAVNDAPVITEGASTSVSMSEDGSPTAFSLTLHATDVDSSMLTWSILTAASHGTASASGKGAAKAISYTPTANYNGTDSFVVQVSDGTATDTITVNVTIAAVNDAPVITEGASIIVTMSEDGSTTPFNLTLHATDVDGDTITWRINTPAGHGSASASGTGTSKAITYTPAHHYIGADSFIVQVSDGHGATDTITVNVTITAVAPPSFTLFFPWIPR